MLRLCVLSALLCSSTVLSAIRFMALGDWGADPNLLHTADSLDPESFGVDDQIRVADGMEAYAAANGPVDFIVSLGDNFYPDGVTSVNDPRWETSWSNIYNGTNIRDLRWYSSLGNHDHYAIGNRYMAQVNYTEFSNQKWYMPDAFYHTFITLDGITIHLVVIDSESLNFNLASEREDQMAWFNQTLYDATQLPTPPDWTFVVAHHPAVSCGRYSPGNPFIERNISTIMDDYKVDLYLNGHDHNMQHFITNGTGGTDYLVLGSGGKGTYEQTLRCQETYARGYTLQYFTEADGFGAITVEKDSLHGEYYGGFPPNEPMALVHSFDKMRNP